MRNTLLSFALMALCAAAAAAPQHACAPAALKQAGKLLAFHAGPDDRIEIDTGVKVLAPLKNPAGKDKYDVLEVYGYIYKGTYRMHFIYAPAGCTLMGQEVLEIANL
ncbi:hypothetical protein ACKI2N_013685 [Cupriavidus sp. 30B13]|uniref:hypothetical protein n=1 Tax=Cupriavidus sp. 30B13 TaxID=3384241 RepID=UPI003B9194D6